MIVISGLSLTPIVQLSCPVKASFASYSQARGES